jgi:hypothetical protein
MAKRVEYRMVENPPSASGCEIMLNEYAEDGWRVIGFSQYQILLERIVNEVETVEQING